MNRTILLPILAALTLLPGALLAAPQCTDAPRAQWMTQAAMKQKVLDQGYTIDVFKISGNCYEVYGKTREGKKVEIYFDPTDGRIVKRRGG
jgi:hypothetical protein